MATTDMRFTSEDAVRFLAAASAKRSYIQNDWHEAQQQLQAVWPRKGHTVLALVHEGEQGLTAEEATDVLTVITQLKPDDPVDVILHTHGGSATAANRIAAALVERTNTAAFVPFYAESAGTELALATETIHLSHTAHLSPIDIHIDGRPARDIVELAKKADASESLLLAAKVAERALRDEAKTVDAMVNPRHKRPGINLAKRLTAGVAYHGQMIRLPHARKLGMHVEGGVPSEIFAFIGKRRAQLRQLREIDFQLNFVHRQEEASAVDPVRV